MPKKNPFKKFFSSSSSSSSSSRLPPPPPPPPAAPPLSLPPTPPPTSFICPICNLLMSHPVIIPTGHSFDFPCLQACRHLNLPPPHLHLPQDSRYHQNFPDSFPPSSTPDIGRSTSSDLPYIANLTLNQAISDYCHLYGFPPPKPIKPESATHFVRALISANSPPPPPLIPSPPFNTDPVQELKILDDLCDTSHDRKRIAIRALVNRPDCTPRILSALIPLLASDGDSDIQCEAAAAMNSLCREAQNRPHILRSGCVRALVTVLKSGRRRAGEAAAGALAKMAGEECYRIAIGALGAIPVLLGRFCGYFLGQDGRMEAGRALCQLSRCEENVRVIVENGGVRKAMTLAGDVEHSARFLRKDALMLVHGLVGSERGREEVARMWAELVVRAVEPEGVGLHVLMVMYRFCMEDEGRFREVAARDGGRTEAVLAADVAWWGEEEKGMATALQHAIRGGGWRWEDEEEEEVVEDRKGKKVVSLG